MTDRRDEEREARIAGELERELTPDEAEDLALLADILGDSATWAEPPTGLEDAVVTAVEHAEPVTAAPTAPGRQRQPKRRRFAIPAVASVAATIAIVVGAVALTSGGGAGSDFAANLAGSPLAPAAHASAAVVHNRAGFRIVLDAHGLAQLPKGEYYQGWLKNDAGTLVPIGTFSSSDGRVTLWSGVSPDNFPKLTVTIEATDNNQASSGRIVLSGEVHAK